MAGGQTVADMFAASPASTGTTPANDSAPPLPAGWELDTPAAPPLPPGWTLAQAPKPKSAGAHFMTGVRDVIEGGVGALDIAGTPLNSLINLATGAHLSTTPAGDVGVGIADALHLPKPESDAEKVVSAINKGGTSGLVTAGAGGAVAPLKGAIGTVGEMFAQAPIKLAASSAIAGGSQQVAADNGAGPVGQTIASLAGGIGGYSALAGLEKAALRLGIAPKAAAIAEAAPRETMVDDAGNLTDEGIHAAVQNEVAPAEIKKAYSVTPEQIKAATEGEAGAVRPEEPAPVAEGPMEAPGAAPEPQAAPLASAVPTSATARLAEAQSLEPPVPLTRGEALQDPVVQRAEQELKATSPVAQTKAGAFRDTQQAAIQENVDQIKSAYGDPNLTAQDRGEALKAGVRELEKQGAAGVRAKYDTASEAIGPETELDHAGILDAADDVIINKPTDPGVIRAIETTLAKFGLTPGEQSPAGRFTVVTPEHGAPITVKGEVTPLTLGNAEEFRQALNAAYRADHNGFTGNIIRALDKSVDAAIEAGASGEKTGLVKAARQAAKEQKANFSAKDIVQKLAEVKNGTSTDSVSAERGIRQVLGSGPDDVSNLKRVKAVLLSKPTEASKAAWKAVQAQGLADIFRSAETPQGISGAKLTSAINRFGRQKLKVLLDPSDFDGLMKVERVTRNATVPLQGTVNYSGSGYAVMRYLAQQGARLGSVVRHVPFIGPFVEGALHILKSGVQGAEAERATKQMLDFGPVDAAKADARKAKGLTQSTNPADFYHDFIDVAGNGAVLRGTLSALSSEQQEAVN